MAGNNSLNSVQMGLITFVTLTGVGVITLPSTVSEATGHDGWISIVLMGMLSLLMSTLIIVLLRRYGDKDIYAINQHIFGRIAGKVLNAALLVYLFVTAIVGSSLFIYFIRITLLQETPAWALAPIVFLPSLYLVWQGLKHISRFLYISIWSYLSIMLLLIFLFDDYRISFLMPVGETGLHKILSSLPGTFFAFVGIELIAFFYPYISDKKNTLKWQVIAITSSIVFFGVTVAITTAIFGENALDTLILPLFTLSRIYNAPILERLDLYLTALWFIPTACSMRSYVFACFEGLQKVLCLRKTKWLYFSFFGVLLFSGFFSPTSIRYSHCQIS